MSKRYNLVTQCTFPAPARAVWDVTVNVTSYPEWWPYMNKVVIAGDETTLQEGSNVHYTIKGFLPHALHFQTCVTRCVPFSCIEMTARGDLEGTGISSLQEENGITLATFQWNVDLVPRVLNRMSQYRLFHKLFVLNHDFAMRSAVKNMQKRVKNVAA